ncbi:MAG: hypothetical protein A3F13_08595 [Gammaproteobacteria bacterium RIFCSPHIGHO2_12_FULL_40_19]|nr:MAG: hypothetical protein A3F13_08595 [Gammaproteobacteria bacterium RIFCSPHIGHO2_12_FULL_40_19]
MLKVVPLGWLHTPIEDEGSFNQNVKDICDLYHAAPELHSQGIHLISCDEKTGIQALERENMHHGLIKWKFGLAF